MMQQVKPPRSVFINFPLGHQCGRPHDVELQTEILKGALSVFATADAAGEIVDLPFEWDTAFDFAAFLGGLEEMLKEEGGAPQDWQPQG
jgi:hypothetical protein